MCKTKPLLLFFACLFAIQSLFAQDNCFTCDYDSLLKQLPLKQTDKQKVVLLSLLIDKTELALFDRNLQLIDQLKEANKSAQLINIDPYEVLRKGLVYWKNGEFSEALRQMKAAIELFDKEHKIIYDLLSNIRVLFALLDQQEERRIYYQNKLSYYLAYGPFQNTASCYHAMGGYYLLRADYNQAISHYLHAAEVYQKFQPNYYYNELIVVGGLYDKWGNLEKAKYYLNEALPLSKAYGDSSTAAYALIALSNISIKNNQLNEAMRYTDEAIVLSDQNRPANTFDAIHSIAVLEKGLIYIHQKKPGLAYDFILQSKIITEEQHPKITTVAGDLETDYAFYLYNKLIKNDQAAEEYLLVAYKKAIAEKSNALKKKYLRELAVFYSEQKQPALSADYLQKYFELNNKLEKEQDAFKIAQFETEKTERRQNEQILEMRQKNALQDVKVSNQRKLVVITLAGLLIVCGLMIFIYRQLLINKKTLNSLRKTQRQLILSEKMASLGEMTAGIAHEIENPLNFVKNFSEVSTDLLKELSEDISRGKYEEVPEVVKDLKINLNKITFHSNKADAIVRGMMMHTKQSTGKKEMVNINALIEEYARLTYHGFKANNSLFMADTIADYDKNIPQIECIPQELGRVFLNIFNNAYYYMHEKKKKIDGDYKPVVQIKTKSLGGEKVEISIKDNGLGIPTRAADKVFQPFFTTKPTGQGTGLGLSISYDIITKGLGGKMEVISIEGESAEFIITI